MSNTVAPPLHAIRAALAGIDDPEYPGLSIVDLGLIVRSEISDSGHVEVDLIPTFSGCPALQMIADEVHSTVEKLDGVDTVQVNWLHSPIWSTDRVSEHGKKVLADRFTVAVQIGASASPCPRCSGHLTDRSMFGPSRCRSISRCTKCGETVEVMRA